MLGFLNAAMNAHENMKYYAIVDVLESLFKLAVAFTYVYPIMKNSIILPPINMVEIIKEDL